MSPLLNAIFLRLDGVEHHFTFAMHQRSKRHIAGPSNAYCRQTCKTGQHSAHAIIPKDAPELADLAETALLFADHPGQTKALPQAVGCESAWFG
jgi:hypothetical protein